MLVPLPSFPLARAGEQPRPLQTSERGGRGLSTQGCGWVPCTCGLWLWGVWIRLNQCTHEMGWGGMVSPDLERVFEPTAGSSLVIHVGFSPLWR